MKQFKITTDDLQLDGNENDCYLDPNDPIHELKIASYLGGLGATARIEQHRINKLFEKNNESK